VIGKLDSISLKYKILYNSFRMADKFSPKVNEYKKQGFEILKSKIDRLPSDVAFVPSFIATRSTCLKIFDKLYIFLSKKNLKKPAEEKFDALFHEVGHWLHFQQMPTKAERLNVWKNANKKKIQKTISERAIQDDDGKEFVAEVFKKIVKGEKINSENAYLYYLLNGPML